MGTAQTSRLPKTTVYGGSGTMSGDITSLRTSIQYGNVVYASHISQLKDMISNMLGHYHTYDDAKQLATYGNNGDRTDYWSLDKATSSISGALSSSIVSGGAISASHQNESAGGSNSIRSHGHTIDDLTTI